MKFFQWSTEQILLALAFLLALGVRLFLLGSPPLTDFEAGWALQALAVARGQAVALGPQPAYVVLTAPLFFVFGSPNFLARLIPALAGSALVFFPLVFRRWLGRRAMLIMAFGLALDPGLAALSRTAGSSMLAVSFALLTLLAIYYRRYIIAGILAGLALLSGPSLLTGLLGAGLALLAMLLLQATGWLAEWSEDGRPAGDVELRSTPSRTALIALVATLFIVGTLFFRLPQALAAAAAAIPVYFSGWVQSSGIPSLRLPAALLLYQPLVLIFGLVGGVRAWAASNFDYSIAKRLALWALFALLVAMLYPARQMDDLAWVLVPLWGLAAFELDQELSLVSSIDNRVISLGQALLLFTLFAYAWENIAGLSRFLQGPSPELTGAIFLLLGALALAIVTTLLVAMGWSWPVAQRGLLWSVIFTFGLYSLASLGAATQLRASDYSQSNLWVRGSGIGQVSLLDQSLLDFDKWNKGQGLNLGVVSLADSPALRWLLRDWTQVHFQNGLEADKLPSLIFTYKEQSSPTLTASYRGQDFVWEISPAWQGAVPPNLPGWLAFRQAPQQERLLILWARSDLFPGGTLGTPQSSLPVGALPVY